MPHTPGPWSCGRSQADDGFGYYIMGSNEHGGTVLPTLAHVYNFPEQTEANARLIAAAPDLLKLAKEARMTIAKYIEMAKALGWGPSTMDDELFESLTVTIAKAE